MATGFTGYVLGWDGQSPKHFKDDAEEVVFSLPQVPLAITGVSIHLLHRWGLEWLKVLGLLLTGVACLFRLVFCILQTVADYMIPSISCRLSTFILVLIVLCNYTKQIAVTKYFASWPTSGSPVVCLGASQTQQNQLHQHWNSLPSWLNRLICLY